MTHLREILRQPSVVLIGWSLVNFLWQGVLVALVVAAVLRANRKSSAETRYAIAGTGLLVMLACPVVTFLVIWAGGHGLVSNPGEGTGFAQPVSASGGDAGPALFAPATLLQWLAQIPSRFPAERLLPFLVTVWAVGVAVLALRLVLGWLQISFVRTTAVPVDNAVIRSRLVDLARRMGIDHPVALLESALAPGPAVIGVLKPAILFPAAALTGLWPIQIEAILAHELAHVRRHDYLVNLLQSMVETLLFYHPAVWWVSKKIRQEREHCCDDLAVQACGDRRFYATCLADLDELKPAQLALAMGAAGGTGLLPRIRRILCLPGGENRAASAAAGILLVAATGTALTVLGTTPAARAEQAREQAMAVVNPTPAMSHSASQSPASAQRPVATVAPPLTASHPNEKVAAAARAIARSSGNASTAHNVDITESSRADGYVAPDFQPNRPYQSPPPPTINIPFPDLSMSQVVRGEWLPRLSPDAASTPSLRQRTNGTPGHQKARNITTDFPPVPPQAAPVPATPATVTPPVGVPVNPRPANTPRTSPRPFNYNGLLFIPENNYVVPQDNNYVTPQDNNYIIPQDRNYIIPDRNYIIPDRNYVAPRTQGGGASSAGGGRMSATPGSGNYVRPAQNK